MQCRSYKCWFDREIPEMRRRKLPRKRVLFSVCYFKEAFSSKDIQHSVRRRWMNVYEALAKWYWQSKTEVLGSKVSPNATLPITNLKWENYHRMPHIETNSRVCTIFKSDKIWSRSRGCSNSVWRFTCSALSYFLLLNVCRFFLNQLSRASLLTAYE